MNFQKKKWIYQIEFLLFVVLNMGLLWFYTGAVKQYGFPRQNIWQILPYFWFSLSMAGAVLAVYYQKLSLDSRSTDALTRGMNESAFRMETEEKMKEQGHACALVIVDIKKFSRIENWYGRAVGDEILKKVYGAMKLCMKEGELLCRANADRFYLLFAESDAEELRKRIYQLDDAVYYLETLTIKERLFLSIGAYLIKEDADTFAHALDCANYCRRESPDYKDRNSHMEIYNYTF